MIHYADHSRILVQRHCQIHHRLVCGIKIERDEKVVAVYQGVKTFAEVGQESPNRIDYGPNRIV